MYWIILRRWEAAKYMEWGLKRTNGRSILYFRLSTTGIILLWEHNYVFSLWVFIYTTFINIWKITTGINSIFNSVNVFNFKLEQAAPSILDSICCSTNPGVLLPISNRWGENYRCSSYFTFGNQVGLPK